MTLCWNRITFSAPKHLLLSSAATLASAPVSSLISASGLLLPPIALLAGFLGAWRFSSDVGLTSGFFVAGGLFSLYQLWFVMSISAQSFSFLLNQAAAAHNLALLAVAPAFPLFAAPLTVRRETTKHTKED